MPNGSGRGVARAGPRIGILLALVALGVVSGGEAEGQVSHALNGTHRRRASRGRAGHAVSEPAARCAQLYCGRREQADFDAARRAGADRGVRCAARGGDGAVRVAGPGPDLRHPRRGRRQGGRRHRGHRRAPDGGASEHDHGVPARRPDARPGADAVDVGPRTAGAARPGLPAGQVQGRDRRGQQHRLQALGGQRRIRRAGLPEVPDGGDRGERQRPRVRRSASCRPATPSTRSTARRSPTWTSSRRC